jgi:hypothetical protein
VIEFVSSCIANDRGSGSTTTTAVVSASVSCALAMQWILHTLHAVDSAQSPCNGSFALSMPWLLRTCCCFCVLAMPLLLLIRHALTPAKTLHAVKPAPVYSPGEISRCAISCPVRYVAHSDISPSAISCPARKLAQRDILPSAISRPALYLSQLNIHCDIWPSTISCTVRLFSDAISCPAPYLAQCDI